MFLMIGISEDRRELEFSQPSVCEACGAYGSMGVYMTCMALALFFIPIFRWNRRYFVQMRCCGSVYELDAEVGRRIARGEQVRILPEHLKRTRDGARRRCGGCGYVTGEDFAFCPKCGRPMG